MTLTAGAFYLFAFVAVAAGFLVISARNPVHSVLWLILTFFSAAGLFVLMGAEFLAMLLVIVYVGAVAVLFLFVVMMLDINFAQFRKGALQYIPIGGLVGLILLAELVTLVMAWQFGDKVADNVTAPIPAAEQVENVKAMGAILYTDYLFIFQTAGLILLVAMIGAIVLTHRQRAGVKRQNISKQVARKPKDAYEMVEVKSGEGIGSASKKG
ncbi:MULTISPECIES: NADH-quinone oxidoreductase subunit J [Kordiimonadales]|uniref:NADH-quinone oxidoreductase subunit J n=1 Tax=Gimibacter soli TaxID=3024400 RepID=A0AAF0BK59_9PROT|nr:MULTISPECIES: NADH-quinone oxidoreductase subunit J [Kordiimonadales]WCL52592.1 NADH-quinone oxidoreductase subunit J [Gimibacter soli]